MSITTEVINYLLHSNSIKIPTDFHQRVKLCKEMLGNDYSGLVTANIDFAINVSSVDFKFETGNKNLTKELSNWKDTINSGFKGKIPSGFKALVIEYLKERWASSLIVMNVKWEKSESSGLILPSKIWFMDAEGIFVDGDESILGDFTYSVKTKEGKKTLPLSTDSDIFVSQPFDRWYNQYPSPFLVRRGTLASWLMKKLLKEKSTEILNEMIAYLLMIKKGTERLYMEGSVNYGDQELSELMDRFKKHVKKKKEGSAEGEVGAWAVPFDTELKEFIPELQKIFSRTIYEEIDRDILSSLGFIEIVEGIESTRRESVLNPRPFIREVYSAINDFASLMEDLVKMIVEKNKDDHKKWFSENTEIKVKPGTPHIGLSALLIHFRSLYDRGLLSKETYLDIVEQDITTEVERRKREAEKGVDETLYPQIIMNREESPYIPDFPEKIENKKPEKKKSEGGNDRQTAKCPDCEYTFDYLATKEAGMGWVKCPDCGKPVTQKDLIKFEDSNNRKEVKCLECEETFTLDSNIDLETTGCPNCNSEYLELVTAPYTYTNYPAQLKNLPDGARTIWIDTFNSVYKDTKDETQARMAAWSNVKSKYKKVGNKWIKKSE